MNGQVTEHARAALLLLVATSLVPVRTAGAQLGGIIRRGAERAERAAAPLAPPAFTEDLLELTPDRVARVRAGLAAAQQVREGPNGAPAIRERIESLDARQAALYERHVGAINEWDSARMAGESCRDSVLSAVMDRKRASSGAEFLAQTRQLGLDYAAAQQRGDTAAMRKLAERFQAVDKPVRADTLAADRSCGAPPPPAAVQQWMSLKDEIDQLQKALQAAEQAELDAEQEASGMNRRQLALACERALLYFWRAERKERQEGFTPAELEALEQAGRDLKKLCG
jgi:hypothetical protein